MDGGQRGQARPEAPCGSRPGRWLTFRTAANTRSLQRAAITEGTGCWRGRGDRSDLRGWPVGSKLRKYGEVGLGFAGDGQSRGLRARPLALAVRASELTPSGVGALDYNSGRGGWQGKPKRFLATTSVHMRSN